MSQNTLIEKIKKDAETAVAEIKSAGQAQVDAVQSETDAIIEKMTAEHKVALEKKSAQMELVALAKAKQEGNIAVQRAKREGIDGIFSEVKSELEDKPTAEYVAFFAKFAGEIIPKDARVTSVSAPAKRVAETESILKDLGLDGKVSEDASLKAGFIARTDDGVYDVTLNRLLDEKLVELETVVFNKLAA